MGALNRGLGVGLAAAVMVAAVLARACAGAPVPEVPRTEPHDADRVAARGATEAPATAGDAPALEATAPSSRVTVPSPAGRAEDSPRHETSSMAAEPPSPDDRARSGVVDAEHSPSAATTTSSAPRSAPGEFVPSEVQPLAFQRTEVTHDELAACVEAGACPARTLGGEACADLTSARGDEPARCVTHAGARAYCRWLGARLPTAAEWVAEATDGGLRRYPWGAEPPSCERSIVRGGCGRGGPWPVCSRPLGHSRTGLCDLIGNVLEWTAEVRDGHARVMGVDLSVNLGRPLWIMAHEHQPDVGFRCVRELRPE